MAQKPRTFPLSVRLSQSIKERVEALAEAERRSVAGLLALLIESALDAAEAEGRPTPRSPAVKAATPLPIGMPDDVALRRVIDEVLAETGFDITSPDGVTKRTAKLAIVRSAFNDAQPQYSPRTNRAHCAAALSALEAAGVVEADGKFVWRI